MSTAKPAIEPDRLPADPTSLKRPGSARAPRVLVVEDDPCSAEMLVFLLNAMGYETVAVGDGAKALAAAKAFRPTLILSDLDLPHRSGLELAADVRHDPALADTPMVALSGRTERDSPLTALKAGFMRYLSKPVLPDCLRRTLEELLDRRRRQLPFTGQERRLMPG